ncbi:MAG: hypothetical protein RL385_2473, partial [Pseudomonadota bacterium]
FLRREALLPLARTPPQREPISSSEPLGVNLRFCGADLFGRAGRPVRTDALTRRRYSSQSSHESAARTTQILVPFKEALALVPEVQVRAHDAEQDRKTKSAVPIQVSSGIKQGWQRAIAGAGASDTHLNAAIFIGARGKVAPRRGLGTRTQSRPRHRSRFRRSVACEMR